ncbi:hypothetical protein ACHHYP_04442 [Achlya hypogyna]|uniref:Transmembrane protein n=1 Tax=Achlya hypogyna TaxID=1202772 RepID=A0A1V9Z123_ACHHY|nr:hypothetical protein ACHHYP_04442 [Achlya hypogyna]
MIEYGTARPAAARYTYVHGSYNPNRYADHRVLYPTRPRLSSCPWACALPAQWMTLRFVLFHVANVVAAGVSAIISLVVILLFVLASPLESWLQPLMSRVVLFIVLQLASLDVHLYNSISPAGEHLYVSFALSDASIDYEVLRALVYFASVKILLVLSTSGLVLVVSAASLAAIVLASTPSVEAMRLEVSSTVSLWLVAGGTGLYVSGFLCHVLGRGYCDLLQRCCVDRLGMYKYVFGYCMSTLYHTPLHLMGFGSGQIV